MKITDNLYRTQVPYKDIYTTVYLIKTDEGAMIFDAASYDSDVYEYILPLTEEAGIHRDDVKYIFISHNHPDHAGGLTKLWEELPKAVVVSRDSTVVADFECALNPKDGTVLMDILEVVALPGHTRDSAAILDRRTNTLITGDSLQLFGIFGSGLWGANIRLAREHMQALDKLKKTDISAVYAAHDYYPCGYYADGAAEVKKYLEKCIEPLKMVEKLIESDTNADDKKIASLYNSGGLLPKLGSHVVAAVRSMRNKKAPYSAERLKADLVNMGICPGDTVLMHSSYKSLGELEGGAQTFFDVLINLLGSEGTLILPALSFNDVTRENPVFDKDNTKSCVGYMAEFFRTRVDGVVRSVHPTHSCCAVGKYAEEITCNHKKDTTPVGKNSPFTQLPEYNGKILMLGCGLKHNTSMHGIEEIVENHYCIDRKNMINYVIKDNGKTYEHTAYPHLFVKDNGDKVFQRYDRIMQLLNDDEIKQDYVLEAKTYLIDACAMWKKGKEAMEKNPVYFVD